MSYSWNDKWRYERLVWDLKTAQLCNVTTDGALSMQSARCKLHLSSQTKAYKVRYKLSVSERHYP